MNLRKELAMEYRQTTDEELEVLWEQNVAEHNYDECWIDWKKEFVENNRSGKAVTFAVLCNGDAVGRVHYYCLLTAMQSPEEKPYVMGKPLPMSMHCVSKRNMKGRDIFLS